VRTSRAATILNDLLTDRFRGIVSCDRAKVYGRCGGLHWCWAHLKRDFQALIDHPDRRVKRLNHDLMRPTKRLLGAWARYRDGTKDGPSFQREMRIAFLSQLNDAIKEAHKPPNIYRHPRRSTRPDAGPLEERYPVEPPEEFEPCRDWTPEGD
jgi:hypothetical protein